MSSCLALALTLSACVYHHEVPPLSAELRAQIVPLAVEPQALAPDLTFGKAYSGKGMAALRGAGASILIGASLAGNTGDPYAVVAGAALGVVFAPVVAAIEAVRTPSGEEMDKAHDTLLNALRAADWDGKWRAALNNAFGDRAPGSEGKVGVARLAIWNEGPWLVVDGHEAIPTMTVHAQLLAGADCLLDRRWRWNGAEINYMMLADDSARLYVDVETGGMKRMAKAMAYDLFEASSGRKVDFDSHKTQRTGGAPLLARVPTNYTNAIAAWDTMGADGKPDLACRAVRSLDPAPMEFGSSDDAPSPEIWTGGPRDDRA